MTTNRIRALREAAGLTLVQLAERVGTTHAQLSRLESGERRLTAEWMVRIAQGLGCAPADLISMAAAAEAETSDVEAVKQDRNGVSRAIATRGLLMYKVTGTSVEESGVKPGDTIVVDIRPDQVAAAKTGDLVLVRVGDDGGETLVLRVFVAPGLLTTNRIGSNISIRVDSPFIRQTIVGVVIHDVH